MKIAKNGKQPGWALKFLICITRLLILNKKLTKPMFSAVLLSFRQKNKKEKSWKVLKLTWLRVKFEKLMAALLA